MTKKAHETLINNTMQIQEDLRTPKKRKMIFHHAPLPSAPTPHGRAGKPKVFSPEEIAAYEAEQGRRSKAETGNDS